MNLRCCVLLSIASALAACGLFAEDEGRDTDAIEPAQDESARGEGDPADDGEAPDSVGERDAARAERDAGGAPRLDASQPVSSDPLRTIDGGAAPVRLDAGFDWATDGAVLSAHDASASVRDGGLIKFDPDASGPVLNPEAQTACIGLLNNICGRSADCQVSLLGLEANMRTRLFESCRNSLWRARNCNRATRTANGFAQCSESTKSLSCIALLATELSTTCADQITLQP